MIIRFQYEVGALDASDSRYSDTGTASVSEPIEEGSYYDDGMAYAAAVETVVEHLWKSQLDKADQVELREITVRVFDLQVDYGGS